MEPGWLNIGRAATYASVNRDTMAAWLEDGLKHSRVGRIVRIKPENIDEYLGQYESKGPVDLGLDKIVGKKRRLK